MRKPADKAIAIFADPVFDAGDPRVKRGSPKHFPAAVQPVVSVDFPRAVVAANIMRAGREAGLTESGGIISRLPFSKHEAESILAVVPSGGVLRATDFKANHTTATSQELSQYRIIHFATHSLLNSTHPELSGIILSLVNESGEPQDGFLMLHEIFNLTLPVELVVLSSCQTGLGKEIKGEGLVGLTRGFMYAGAPRIIASLWNVDDWATAELMKRFYQNMTVQKLRPSAALRVAQMEMLKKKRWQAPYYWAAFILQGEWK